MKVILIGGKSASGKDQLAQLMQEWYEKEKKKVLVIHFADVVKFYAKQYFDWDGNKDEHGRKMLQYVGTTLMRGYDPDYWARMAAEFIAAQPRLNFDICLIPDWRFPNEFQVVGEYNPKVVAVRIERYNEDGSAYVNPNMTYEQSHHISEVALDDFPFEWIVENRGTIDDLRDSVDEMLLHI